MFSVARQAENISLIGSEIMFTARTKARAGLPKATARPLSPRQQAALRRNSSSAQGLSSASIRLSGAVHPFTKREENQRLREYEQRIKGAFAGIEAVLQEISTQQHESDFVNKAQAIARSRLGYELPEYLLEDSWIKPLNIGKLYSWCVFETFQQMSNEFFGGHPLSDRNEAKFQSFIESCGFHLMDVSPCADGRLAHVIRYVLRLPYKVARRRSYAGAMFDVDDSLRKWTKTELFRHREGQPNTADEPTRYLKVAVYHYSSSQPDTQGCAAHGSDVEKAAAGALARLHDFRQGVENRFCCGASIDLLLIGMDTDNDSIRLHLPDAKGYMDVSRFVESTALYSATSNQGSANAQATIEAYLTQHAEENGASLPEEGMLKLAAYLLCQNISQIDYVRQYHNGCYSDIGHNESFIGIGIGFEEVQLRNLTFFAYLKTVEEGAADVDVGIKIFTGLNVKRGLPIPIVIRQDYHSNVPAARERAEARCHMLDEALKARFSNYVEQGMLHTLLMVRDCSSDGSAEMIGCSLHPASEEAH